ncbi:hypothetical protein BHM03_00062607 [Ensete ventricosum]|nr:hypothetical protein BHM03_00062607 [Ensete ventricosum]
MDDQGPPRRLKKMSTTMRPFGRMCSRWVNREKSSRELRPVMAEGQSSPWREEWMLAIVRSSHRICLRCVSQKKSSRGGRPTMVDDQDPPRQEKNISAMMGPSRGLGSGTPPDISLSCRVSAEIRFIPVPPQVIVKGDEGPLVEDQGPPQREKKMPTTVRPSGRMCPRWIRWEKSSKVRRFVMTEDQDPPRWEKKMPTTRDEGLLRWKIKARHDD